MRSFADTCGMTCFLLRPQRARRNRTPSVGASHLTATSRARAGAQTRPPPLPTAGRPHPAAAELKDDLGTRRRPREMTGRRELEQSRIPGDLRRWPDGVAQAHVDLDHQAGLAQSGRQHGPRRRERPRRELPRCLGDRRRSPLRPARPLSGRFSEVLLDRAGPSIAPAQQVEVEHGPTGPLRPEPAETSE